MAKIFNKKIEN